MAFGMPYPGRRRLVWPTLTPYEESMRVHIGDCAKHSSRGCCLLPFDARTRDPEHELAFGFNFVIFFSCIAIRLFTISAARKIRCRKENKKEKNEQIRKSFYSFCRELHRYLYLYLLCACCEPDCYLTLFSELECVPLLSDAAHSAGSLLAA